MTRTTLDLDSSVLAELRRRSVREQVSTGELASRLLASSLQDKVGEARPIRWKSADLGRPRIDLEDKDALHAALDRDR